MRGVQIKEVIIWALAGLRPFKGMTIMKKADGYLHYSHFNFIKLIYSSTHSRDYMI